MGQRKLIIALVIAAIVILALWRPWQEHPIAVFSVVVDQGLVEATAANTRTGTVKACRRSKLSMPTGGTVADLLVDEGDHVEGNQLLLELWNRDKQALVDQAEQQLLALQEQESSTCLTADLKEREAKRLEQLLDKKLTSEDKVDAARTDADSHRLACSASRHQCQVARATLDQFQAQLELTQLRAPFAGIIAEINGEVGEYITPSPPGIPTPAAIDLIDYSCLYVTAPIDEIDAGAVTVGLPARVTLDAFRGITLNGTVSRIAPYVLDLEKQARTVDVDVTLDAVPEAVHLLVGYSADITIILQAKASVVRLPSEAILSDNSVWLIDKNNRLHRQPITTGLSNWTYTEVTSGLQAGDRVVRSPDLPNLAEGRLTVAHGD
ncbi:efflux RND transporter periplasmic adaptor subunit [Halioxenophilus sp. WMMB6]|uniref:efflux RND transporter periplasmic adaptor subunit n=1 Tax=Halioxenophilus sp. WMMB6 TaxID=3073815 RepID=UPI00295F3586|nr:efflux RND transporter periplasmic adaptor subunit [Halioxenophilus sp. WMMB6]